MILMYFGTFISCINITLILDYHTKLQSIRIPIGMN